MYNNKAARENPTHHIATVNNDMLDTNHPASVIRRRSIIHHPPSTPLSHATDNHKSLQGIPPPTQNEIRVKVHQGSNPTNAPVGCRTTNCCGHLRQMLRQKPGTMWSYT
jgi:hypothetical protein